MAKPLTESEVALVLPTDGQLNWGDEERAAIQDVSDRADQALALAVKFVAYGADAWPARPAGGTSIRVIWLDSLGQSTTDPADPLAGDLLIRGASA
jgi:hypothetical protein